MMTRVSLGSGSSAKRSVIPGFRETVPRVAPRHALLAVRSTRAVPTLNAFASRRESSPLREIDAARPTRARTPTSKSTSAINSSMSVKPVFTHRSYLGRAPLNQRSIARRAILVRWAGCGMPLRRSAPRGPHPTSRRDRRRNDGKENVKRRPAFARGRYPDRSLEVVDDSRHDGETEAGALARPLGREERIEDSFRQLTRHARPRVGDDDLGDLDCLVGREPALHTRRGWMLDDLDGAIDAAARRRLPEGEARGALEPNDNRAAAVHRVHGVHEQVDEHLLDVVSLAGDEEWQLGELERDIDCREHSLRSEERCRRANDLVDVHRRWREWSRARVVEKSANDSIDARTLTFQGTQRIERFGPLAKPLAQAMHLAKNGAKGISYLLRDAGSKLSNARQLLSANQLRLVLDHAFGEPIEGRGNLVQLPHRRLRHSTREIAGDDLFGCSNELTKRPYDRALQQERGATDEE